MKLALITTAAAAVALAVAPVAAADTEDDFLRNLEAGGFSWPDDASAQGLVDLAYGVCGELDSGTSAADLITDGIQSTGWNGGVMGYFVGAATTSFCPEHYQRALEEAQAMEG